MPVEKHNLVISIVYQNRWTNILGYKAIVANKEIPESGLGALDI